MGKKVVLITGASSGLGYELAEQLSDKVIVYACARRMEKMEKLKKCGVHTRKIDVQNTNEVNDLVDEILEKHKRIDVVYANAGYGEYGAIEAIGIEEAKRQMDINVHGVHRVINAVLPNMRKRNVGRIIVTSSLIANVTMPFSGWYGASKHAIDAVVNSLRMELAHTGIKVISIEPGMTKTGFGDVAYDILENSKYIDTYENFKQAYLSYRDNEEVPISDKDNTIKAMIDAGFKRNPKNRYRTTIDAKIIPIVRKVLGNNNFYNLNRSFIELIGSAYISSKCDCIEPCGQNCKCGGHK